jgi:hypothetical protein
MSPPRATSSPSMSGERVADLVGDAGSLVGGGAGVED